MEAAQLTALIEAILQDKKARDIVVIDLEGKTILADRFVLASGTSITHVRALADALDQEVEARAGITARSVEGLGSGRWILMDYGDVVVHLFHPEDRSFYNLEKLWRGRPSDGTAAVNHPEP